jgi:hypothetical protein
MLFVTSAGRAICRARIAPFGFAGSECLRAPTADPATLRRMTTLRIIDHTGADYDRQVAGLLSLLRSGGLVASDEKSALDVASIVRDILAQVERD